ncbi:hypothetical protein FUAX_12860 [Fulvitalea axinellae]|uniref:Uncharacterized protein n=1 Tax=Fulvitalea axinellae TaxID=1182444 RepID=A0AAU9D384_9BACT|nr:hypothetical protein FUAX_12860 [Fulvitalea axinellae]
MAKGKRDAKKTVNYLVGELIGECLAQMGAFSDLEKENQIKEVIIAGVALRNDMIGKINAYKKSDKAKTYFSDLNKELLERVDAQFDKLFEIVKA